MKFRNLVIALLFLGLLFNIFSVYNRIIMEKNYNFVEFALDYSELKEFSRIEGKNFIDTLSKIRELDIPVTSIVFKPLDIFALQSTGKLTLFSGNDILKMLTVEGIVNPIIMELDKTEDIKSGFYYVFTKDYALFKLIKNVLLFYYKPEIINDRSTLFKSIRGNNFTGYLLEIKKGSDDFCNIPICLPVEDIRLSEKMGFIPELRLDISPFFFKNKKLLREIMVIRKDISAFLLDPVNSIINEDNNLSFLFDNDSKICINEFKFGNFSKAFLNKYKNRLLRSHDVEKKLFHDYSQYLLYRYFRAAQERNVRHLIFHLNTDDPSIEKLGFFLKLLKEKLANGLISLSIRENKPLEFSFHMPDFIRIFLESSVILTFFMIMINPIIQLPVSGSTIIVIFSSTIFGLGSFYVEKFYFDKVLAQFASFFFPIFGYLYWRNIYSFVQSDFKKDIKYIVKNFLKFTAINMYGILSLLALLNSSDFFLKVLNFRSVKLALIVPVFLLSIFLILQFSNKRKVYNFFTSPINIAFFFTSIATILILAIFLIRSGNISRAYIPDFEDTIRNFLDKVLIVRPRFKEFLWGFPLFFVAFNFTGFLRFFLLILSSIGQISLFNTFCHFHTPFIISFVRSINGIFLGILLGIFLNFILRIAYRFINNIIETEN